MATQAESKLRISSAGNRISAKVQRVLSEYDVNKDGQLDMNEICELVNHVIHEERKVTWLKYGMGALSLFTLMLLGSMFGLTWVVVSSLKDTRISHGTVMVTNAGETVQVASSDYMIVNDSLVPRDRNNTSAVDNPLRTGQFIGNRLPLLHSDVNIDVLMEMKFIHLTVQGVEAVLSVVGVFKNAASGKVSIMTQSGSVELDEEGVISFDDDLMRHWLGMGASFDTGKRKMLTSHDVNLGGYFGYVADVDDVTDDGSWWMINASDKKGAKENSKKLNNMGQSASGLARAWQHYKKYYAKAYSASDDAKRFSQFKKNLMEVLRINQDENIQWWASGNSYSDMEWDEFRDSILMTNIPNLDHQDSIVNSRHLLQYPSVVDWRSLNKVTRVKDQGSCGGCWAFAATSAIESAYLITHGSQNVDMDLSEQHFISCISTSYGCRGGSSWDAFAHAINHNQTYEYIYPYTVTTGTCNLNLIKDKSTPIIKQTGFVGQVAQNSASQLMIAVARQPVVNYFMVDASFVNYAGGIFTSSTCTTSVNHAMVIVGYDAESKYWIIRNSWGENWGEAGYARVMMQNDNTIGMCGMYQWSFYPPMKFVEQVQSSPHPPPSPSPYPHPPPLPSPSLPSPSPHPPSPSPHPPPPPSLPPHPPPLPSPSPSPHPPPLPSPLPSPHSPSPDPPLQPSRPNIPNPPPSTPKSPRGKNSAL